MRSVAETDGSTADDIYSVRPSGNAMARLTRTARIDEFDPRYFAGGIVYSRGESGDDASAYADVYTMRRNGKKAKALVAGAGSAYVEDVTPDGNMVLFRRDRGLWVKRIGPGAARKLTELPDGSQTNGGLLVRRQAGRRVHRRRRSRGALLDRRRQWRHQLTRRRVRTLESRQRERNQHDRPGHHLAADPLGGASARRGVFRTRGGPPPGAAV